METTELASEEQELELEPELEHSAPTRTLLLPFTPCLQPLPA